MSHESQLAPPSLGHMFKTGSLFEDPVLDRAPADPYPGWKPKAGGDASALAPYVDDDLREEKEPSNPVGAGISIADGVHTAADAVIEGETSGATFGQLATKMSHEATEVLAGEGSTAQTALMGSTAALAPVSIAGGIMDMIEGIGDIRRGNTMEGTFTTTAGGLGILSGGSSVVGLAGVGSAAAAAPLLATGATAIKTTRYGDQNVKKRGWLHDSEGNALSASEWAGHNGRAVDDYLTKHGHPYLGTAAGIATTAGSVVPAAAMALGGAGVGAYDNLTDAGHSLGKGMANGTRAFHYAHYQGMDLSPQEGKELANYDDGQEAAVERSKREHPERWGHNPNNPTFAQFFDTLQADAHGGNK